MKSKRDKFIGLSQPFTNSKNGYFNPSITSDERIKSNLKHLLLTNRGERIMHPDFGCDIYKVLFENIDNVNLPLDSLRDRIKEQVKFWMPYIMVNNIKIKIDEDKENVINISLNYTDIYGGDNDTLNIDIVAE